MIVFIDTAPERVDNGERGREGERERGGSERTASEKIATMEKGEKERKQKYVRDSIGMDAAAAPL